MSESTLSYCQIADRRYEADTSAESECPYCRALAAEARAAQLEAERVELIDWRDAGAVEIEQLTAERDAFATENEAIHRAVNEMCGTDTSTIEAVQHVINERDEARRKLEQAVSAEREECAKVAESVRMIHGLYIGEIAYSRQTASDIASAIRARSNKTK